MISYYIFRRGVNKWHGVVFQLKLQRFFNAHGKKVQIVCGGVPMKIYDPDSLCLNFLPHRDKDCLGFLRVADVGLLSVVDIRVNPRSLPKLYCVIVNKRTGIALRDRLGCSDEFDRFNLGILVDLRASDGALEIAFDGLFSSNLENKGYSSCRAICYEIIDRWLAHIFRVGLK